MIRCYNNQFICNFSFPLGRSGWAADFVLKSNGSPQLRLKKEGGVEVESEFTVMGNVRLPNLQQAAQNSNMSFLVKSANGLLATMDAGNIISRHQPSCELNDPMNGIWFKPTIIDNNNNGAVTSFPERIMLDHAFTKFGLGLTCTEAHTEQLHVKGNQLLNGEIEISGSRLHVDKETGNVGIGTSNPAAKLEVSGATQTQMALSLTSGNDKISLVPNLAGADYNYLSLARDKGLFWSDGNQNSTSGFVIAPWQGSWAGLRIAANGNVGIGEPNPTDKAVVSDASNHLAHTLKGGWEKKVTYWATSTGGSFGFGVNKAGFGQLYMGKSIYDSNRDHSTDPSAIFTVRDSRYINWGDEPKYTSNSLISMDLVGNETAMEIYLPNPGNSSNKPKGISVLCGNYNTVNAIEVKRHHNGDFRKQFVVTSYGEVYCRLLWVKADQTEWPDYVFENSYKLPTLPEIELRLKKQKHLEGIQTAKEVETNGLDVLNNLKGQTQHIEEIYLHLISLEKRVKELEKENSILKAKK